MARIDLYVDIVGKRFVLGPNNNQEFQLSELTQNDYQNFNVYFLQRTTSFPTYPPFFTTLNTANLDMKMAIGDKQGVGSGSYVTNQFTWAKSADGLYFTASLPLNTPGVADAIGNASALSGKFLEIELTDNGLPLTVYSKLITISADVIKNGVAAPAPGQTAISAETANNTFLKQVGDKGQVWVSVSPDGNWQRLTGVGNGGIRIDIVQPTPPECKDQ